MDSLRVRMQDNGDGSTGVRLSIDGGRWLHVGGDIPYDGYLETWLDGNGRERVEESYDGQDTTVYCRDPEGKVEKESTFAPYLNREIVDEDY